MIGWKTRLAVLALLSLTLVPPGVRAAEGQIHGVIVTVRSRRNTRSSYGRIAARRCPP